MYVLLKIKILWAEIYMYINVMREWEKRLEEGKRNNVTVFRYKRKKIRHTLRFWLVVLPDSLILLFLLFYICHDKVYAPGLLVGVFASACSFGEGSYLFRWQRLGVGISGKRNWSFCRREYGLDWNICPFFYTSM